MTDGTTPTFAAVVGFEPGLAVTTAVRHHPLAVGFAVARRFRVRLGVFHALTVSTLDRRHVGACRRRRRGRKRKKEGKANLVAVFC